MYHVRWIVEIILISFLSFFAGYFYCSHRIERDAKHIYNIETLIKGDKLELRCEDCTSFEPLPPPVEVEK